MTAGRGRAGLALGVAVALVALVHATAALAHATLVSSSPADGAVMAAAPETFRLTFNEPVAVTLLLLSGGGAGSVSLEGVRAEGGVVEVGAPAGLAQGGYALSYRVVSEDGHPVAGAVAFSIGRRGADLRLASDSAAGPLKAAIWAVRAALYLGLMFGVGGAFALAWLGGDGRRDGGATVAGLLALGLAAAPAALALQGADLVGATLGGALQGAAWRQALATSYAWTLAAASAAMVAALVSLVSRGVLAQALSGAALCGVGLALAASGHASAAAPQALMRAVVLVHAVAAAFWMGALVPLGLALARDAGAATAMLARFAKAAPVALAALTLAGAALALRQVPAPRDLWTTDYGLVLSAKLGLVAALFLLAALNRWRWTRPTLRGDAAGAARLRRSVMAEILIGAVILGLVALWRFTPPPRSLAATVDRPALAHLQTRAAQADVTLAPGRAGRADMSLTIMTGDFGPLDAKQVSVALSNPAAGVEPIRREARKPGDGTWRVDGLTLPVAGRWTVAVEILVTDFDVEKLGGEIDVRP